MRRLFNISLILFLSSTALTQTIVERQKNEPVNTFFTRVKPPPTNHKSISLNQIIVSPYRNNKDTAFIVSYYAELNVAHRYFIYLFFPIDSNKYKQILVAVINSWEKTDIPPIIRGIFFANADKDPDKEIVIFYSYTFSKDTKYFGTTKFDSPNITKTPAEGIPYQTQVFDAPDKNKLPDYSLSELRDMPQKLFGGFEGKFDGKTTTKTRFKTAKDIKKELIRLGY